MSNPTMDLTHLRVRIREASENFQTNSGLAVRLFDTKIGQIEFQVNSPADSLDSLLSKVLAHLSHSFHVFSCLKSPSQVMQSMGFDLSEDRKQNIPTMRNQQSSYDNLQQLTTTTTTTFRLSCESPG